MFSSFMMLNYFISNVFIIIIIFYLFFNFFLSNTINLQQGLRQFAQIIHYVVIHFSNLDEASFFLTNLFFQQLRYFFKQYFFQKFHWTPLFTSHAHNAFCKIWFILTKVPSIFFFFFFKKALLFTSHDGFFKIWLIFLQNFPRCLRKTWKFQLLLGPPGQKYFWRNCAIYSKVHG